MFIWESQFYRLDAPGGDLSKAHYAALTTAPRDMKVIFAPPSDSAKADNALFMLQMRDGVHAGLRTHVTKDTCPDAAVPTAGPGTEAPAK